MNYRGTETWRMNAVKMVFFTEKGDKYVVTGEEGLVNSEERIVEINGKVIVRSQNGYKFSTEIVRYSTISRKLLGPKPIEMLGPRDINGNSLYLTGDSMEADMTTSEIQIKGNIKSRKTFANERLVKIVSDEAKFSGETYSSRFLGGVTLDSEAMRNYRARSIFQFDPGSDQVVSIQLIGGVRVSDPDKWATAESLTAFFDQNKFIFKGSPRVVQDADELRGDEIIFIDGGKRVKVLRAKAKVDKKRLENVN
ncbi:MAG: LPS export ABC transporter periplasmic protein LptC [Bdellovibrionales bacterium]